MVAIVSYYASMSGRLLLLLVPATQLLTPHTQHLQKADEADGAVTGTVPLVGHYVHRARLVPLIR